MPRAKWKDAVLADSDKTIIVEGNHYFPPDSIDRQYFQESKTRSTCPWKGLAYYYTVRVGDDINSDAACITQTRRKLQLKSRIMLPSGKVCRLSSKLRN